MKRLILMLLIATFAIQGVYSKEPSNSTNTIVVTFGESGKFGELVFDKETNRFLTGWITYPVAGGEGLYYRLSVNSVSGILLISLGEVIPLPIDRLEDNEFQHQGEMDNTKINNSFFSGTIFYGNAQENGSLVLHSGNNSVL